MPESQYETPPMLRALRHRNFRLFFLGQLISLIGTWMESIAQSWLVYRMTGSAALLGWVGFASQIPVFLLAPFGGEIADRLNRQKVIIATQSASMALAAILAWDTLSGQVQVWHLMVLAALLGLVNSIDIPTRQTFVRDMVGREDLPNAIALNSSMVNGARIVGPAVAGIVVAVVGEGWCFFANAVSYIAVIAGLLMMKLQPFTRQESAASPLSHIAEGFRFVLNTAPILAILALLGVVSLVAMPYSVLMPIFADQILHGGPKALGILMGSSGLGALTGALLLAARSKVYGLGRWVASATALFGLMLILFSQSRNYWLSVALLFPAGLAMMVQMAASNTLVQAMVPDELRGRVMAVYAMMFMGMAPFGGLLAGMLAHKVGAPMVAASGGVLAIVTAAAFALRLPALRPEGRRLIVSQQMVGGRPAEEATAAGG